ncbi:MAG TPA: TadE/TadG family type IV pilus assembly protein [Mycobacteriales bacterium]|nr:TadE/TadG family type IV pilus assembly protein [Mycobacteriales bacterium]
MSRRPLRRSRTARQERGSTSLEFAMLSVVFLLLVFLTVQAALYYHARNVIKAEAEGTARAVRAYPSNVQLEDSVPSPAQVQALAQSSALAQWQLLDDSGDTTSRPVAVGTVDNATNQVRITVTANPILIIPGLFGGDKLTITATAGGPFEIFKRSGDT